MATATASILQDVLLEIVEPMVTKQFQEKYDVIKWLGFGNASPVNLRGKRYPAYLKANASGGYFSEAGTLPAVGRSTNGSMRVGNTRYAMGFGFSGDFVANVKSRESLVDGIDEMLARDEATLLTNFAQDAFGDGTGKKAIVLSATSTTITCSITTAGGDTLGAQRLLVDGVYEVRTTAGVQRTGGSVTTSTVSSIVQSTGVATFDAVPSDAAATDYVVRSGSWYSAFRGLGYHISSNSLLYQGLSRADNPGLNATMIAAASQNLTFALVTKMKYAAKFRRDGSGEQAIIAPYCQQYQYELLGHSLRRASMDDKVLRAGFDQVESDGVTWMTDRWMDEDKIYYVNKGSFEWLELEALGLLKNQDGSVLRLEPSTSGGGYKDNWVGFYIWRGELACKQPRENGAITGLGMPSDVRGYSYAI